MAQSDEDKREISTLYQTSREVKFRKIYAYVLTSLLTSAITCFNLKRFLVTSLSSAVRLDNSMRYFKIIVDLESLGFTRNRKRLRYLMAWSNLQIKHFIQIVLQTIWFHWWYVAVVKVYIPSYNSCHSTANVILKHKSFLIPTVLVASTQIDICEM